METENKLQQLTEKLYNEGLSKGRQEADQLVAEAKAEAARLIEEAKAEAAKIIASAGKEAAQLHTTTQNELQMAAQQLASALRQQIQQIITAKSLAPHLSKAWEDGSFLKELMLAVAKEFAGGRVILPAGKAAELEKAFKEAAAHELAGGIEVVTDGRVKVPFRIAPKEGNYYVSFTDSDFNALFESYLRPRIVEWLFDKKEQ